MKVFPINVGKLILIGRLSKVLFGMDVLREEMLVWRGSCGEVG